LSINKKGKGNGYQKYNGNEIGKKKKNVNLSNYLRDPFIPANYLIKGGEKKKKKNINRTSQSNVNYDELICYKIILRKGKGKRNSMGLPEWFNSCGECKYCITA